MIPLLLILFCCQYASGQKTLDPSEVNALRAFGSKLGITIWNFSVDPCSGQDGWNDTEAAQNYQPASGVVCDCGNSSDVCHVTRLVYFNKDAAGEIAPEVGNFSYLYDLNLGQNVITGTLPEEVGSLTRLQYLNVGINRLSGSLPTSIGKLTALLSIGIGTNYMNGTLPREIGNLKVLEQLYMDSSGLSGEIPSEFGNLQKLRILSISDNKFNGTLDFLKNLTSLEELTMEGNKFQGPIPSGLDSHKKLKKIYIGDVSAGGIIPGTFNQLNSLTRLSLRNCELSGTVPQLNLTSLTLLDLSFNNLTGAIPSTLASLSSLDTLILANNNFTGELPTALGSLTNLQRLDVSFNKLSGSLPRWLNQSKLQENIIGNNFNVSNSQGLNAAEMNCLEGGLRCNTVDDGKNFQVDINCGGPRLVTSNGVEFTEDSTPLTETVRYSNSSQSWAVSSTGYAEAGGNKFDTVPTASTRVIGTNDPALYQTARSAPTSLRYFGLGLYNGVYRVELHFAEIVIADNSSGWTSLGRRFFDVYIQGSRVLQDFDIRAEAGGSFRALTKNYTTNVSSNVLEVHLLWRGKGTCCSPAPNSFGPLISAIRILPTFDTTGLRPAISSGSNGSKGVAVGVGVGVSAFVIFLVILGIFCLRRKLKQKLLSDEEDLKSLEAKPNLFTYNDMKMATKGFAAENKLGQGGFGTVYKGVLADGTLVAIKELSSKSNQGTREFLNEVTVISAVQHRNLVKLHGCCIEGTHRLLIYEFLENNSLHHALLSGQGPKLHLDWQTRFNICVGVARGIAYLHEESLPRIIHRDIKASNVLLDKSMNPKIADFGLAKLFHDHQTHVSTRVAGTIGYLAPEYAMRGQLTEKADVYSFGVLALEVVSGRENLNTNLPTEIVYLLEWAWYLYENNRALELLDPDITEFCEEEVVRVIQVALLCSQALASSRPSMSRAVAMLLGTAPVDVSGLQPGYFTALKNSTLGFFTDAADRLKLAEGSSVEAPLFNSHKSASASNVSSALSADSKSITQGR